MEKIKSDAGCAGRVSVVDSEDKIGLASDYLFILRVKDICPYYLTLYLNTTFGKIEINKLKHGVSTISINKQDIKTIEIPIIPKDKESYFGNIYSEAVNSKNNFMISAIISELEKYLLNGDY